MHPEMMIKNIKKYSKQINKRINIVILLLALMVIGLSGKIFYLQIFQSRNMEKICLEKSVLKYKDPAERGEIRDSRGNIIATNIISHNLYIRREKINNKQKLIRDIAQCGILSRESITEKLNSKFSYIALYYNLSQDQIDALESLNNDAVIIHREQIRHYIHPRIFSPITGFVGMDNQGLEGIEYLYNDELKGKEGYVQYQRKPTGRMFKHPSNQDKPARKGKDIVLTLRSRYQEIAHNELAQCVEKYNARSGNIIIMHVESGEILAMTSYPSYNSNQLGSGVPGRCKNHSILSLYEPGSIFKMIIAAAAIEYSKVGLNDIVKKADEDSLVINGHIIKDAHESDELTFEEAFIQSSNIGFVNIGKKVGKRLFYVMINAMGFNRRVDIKLPGEQKGILLHERDWIPIHQANICFGQGISVTALQMIASYNIVANRGVYVKPTIIKSIGNNNTHSRTVKRIIRESTAGKLNSLLESVVKRGTGKKASVDGISIAGKTGTAEKSSQTGGYAHDRYISSFVGYFPSDNPEYIMIVTVDEPRGIYWGSEVAAPLFSEITRQIINLRENRHLIKPEKEIQA